MLTAKELAERTDAVKVLVYNYRKALTLIDECHKLGIYTDTVKTANTQMVTDAFNAWLQKLDDSTVKDKIRVARV